MPEIKARVRVRTRPLLIDVEAQGTSAGGSELPPTPRFNCVAIEKLEPAKRSIRVHKRGALRTLISLMERYKYSPVILVTGDWEIIDGHLVLEAYVALGAKTVPVRIIDHLDEAEIKAFRISLHAFLDLSEFDEPAVGLDLKYIIERDPLLLTYTALPMPKVDVLLNLDAPVADAEENAALPRAQTSRLGDRWIGVGGMILYHGDAKDPASYAAALDGKKADMICADPPYGIVPIKNVVSRKHEEFFEGSSMTKEAAGNFFYSFFTAALPLLKKGGICDVWIDWRGMSTLEVAACRAGLKHLITCTWAKDVGGMGGLYRNANEYCLILKNGNAPHTNNVKLGKFGRNRTTNWSCPGFSQFGPGRAEALEAHPTVKPVALLMDMILDVTNPGETVLDPFVGSGSTLIAAYRTRRVGVGIEISGAFVDAAVERIERVTGEPMRHAGSGLTFSEMTRLRAGENVAGHALDEG